MLFLLWCRRITALPPQHIGDIENCLVICPKDADLAKIAEESSALILRFGSAEEVQDPKPLRFRDASPGVLAHITVLPSCFALFRFVDMYFV